MNNTEFFMLNIFGHDVKHIEMFRNKKITTYKLWKYLTEEQFKYLSQILEDRHNLGIQKYSVFFSTIEKMNTEIKSLSKKDLAKLKKKIYDKEHRSKPEVKAKAKIQTKEYRNRPEVNIKYKEWYNAQETILKRKKERQLRRKRFKNEGLRKIFEE